MRASTTGGKGRGDGVAFQGETELLSAKEAIRKVKRERRTWGKGVFWESTTRGRRGREELTRFLRRMFFAQGEAQPGVKNAGKRGGGGKPVN